QLRSYLWRRRRSELGDVSKAQAALDRANLLDGVFETILTKLLMLDVFKFIVHLVELFAGHRLLPGGKDDCVFTRGMVAIHPYECLKGLCQRFGIICAHLCALG